jgi:hypothetical protein
MMVDLWREKLLLKANTQPANNSSGHRRDEQHNTKVDRQMPIWYAKIVYLAGVHLQKKKKTNTCIDFIYIVKYTNFKSLS